MKWEPFSTAPLERDLELAVIDDEGIHALVFRCRRTNDGWVDANTGKIRGAPYPLARLAA
jgi:hypothetical protein